MLLNILFVLAIIWLTFAIASILVGMYYTYTVVLPYLIDWDSSEETPKGWDSVENADQSQLTNDDLPEWTIGAEVIGCSSEDDDLPF